MSNGHPHRQNRSHKSATQEISARQERGFVQPTSLRDHDPRKRDRQVSTPVGTIAKKPAAVMQTGEVVWFKDDKGFGFIRPDNGGKDVFVHHTGIAGEPSARKGLAPGDKVEFTVKQDPKGPRAENVTVVK